MNERDLYRLRIEAGLVISEALNILPSPTPAQHADFCLQMADKIVNKVRLGFPEFNYEPWSPRT
jgi:hypothetical protein